MDFVTSVTNIIGPYALLPGNGTEQLNLPWITSAIILLLTIWFIYRIVINFVSGLFK